MRFLHRPGHSLGLLSFLPTQHAIDGSTSTSPDDRHQDQTQRQQVILESFSRLSAGPFHEEPIRLVDRQQVPVDKSRPASIAALEAITHFSTSNPPYSRSRPYFRDHSEMRKAQHEVSPIPR